MRIKIDTLLLSSLLALPFLAGCTSGEPDHADEPVTPKAEAETSAWEAGGTIPHSIDGVKPIEILEVRANGSGPVCGTNKKATLAYKAMKANGEVLDPGTRPFSFTVGPGNAIKGWHTVVAQMRVGDDFTILLPEALAYAGRGDLKFDMRLLSFE